MNGHSEEAFPLPPWETQSIQETHSFQEPQFTAAQPQSMQTAQASEVYSQMMPPNHQPFPMQNGHVPGMYQYPMQDGQMTGMHFQPVMQGPGMQWQPGMVGQTVGMQLPPAMQGGQMVGMHLQPAMQSGQMSGGFAYAQQQPGVHPYYNQMRPGYPAPGPTNLTQGMMNMSMGMNTNPNYQMPPSSLSSSSYVQSQQPMKPIRPVDTLFGDLVSIAKTKPNK